MRKRMCPGACMAQCSLTTFGWSKRSMDMISLHKFETKGTCWSPRLSTTLTASRACVSTLTASVTTPKPPMPSLLPSTQGPTCTPSANPEGKDSSNCGKPLKVRCTLRQNMPVGGSRSSASFNFSGAPALPQLGRLRRRLAMAALTATSNASLNSASDLAFHTTSSAPAARNSSMAFGTSSTASTPLGASTIQAMMTGEGSSPRHRLASWIRRHPLLTDEV
mmetsp:Transcript_98299/g.283671  ORF Transcript_98299/g.283671 Transcript_98299/m.283671 type:complete len:221 (-) Transcript_98299:442-1104(-)